MALTLSHLIDGRWTDSMQTDEIRSPSDTSQRVASFPLGTAETVNDAVLAARAAFPAWSRQSPEARADCLDRAGALVLARQAELADLLAREEGKTLAEAAGEVGRAGRILRHFAGEAVRIYGRTVASVRQAVDVRTHQRPVGVFGLITPWNFPIAIPAWKTAPALAAGNCVVLAPSALTPATAAAFAAILVEAGIPNGVFNMVLGGAEVGAALAAHPEVDGVSFTGSQGVGRKVAMACAARNARVQLEMGGKNALVVLDDADLARAVAVAVDGAYFATGQRCTASSRLIVTAGIHDRFTAALREAVSALQVGPSWGAGTRIGPVVSARQAEGIRAHVAAAVAEGAKIGAQAQLPADLPTGHYVAPLVLEDTDMAMAINSQEVFGPVASVIRVAGLDEAIAVANGTPFGLAAGIVTTSLDSARIFEREARAGLVMVNLPTAGVDYHVPFGGTRSSSLGPREQGFAATDFYTETRTVYVSS